MVEFLEDNRVLTMMKKNAIIIGVACIVLAIVIGLVLYVVDMRKEMAEIEQERTDYEFATRTQLLSVARSYIVKHPSASPEHIAEIEQRIKGLVEDSTDWAVIKACNDPSERYELLKKYLSYYPSSVNAIEARKMREVDSVSAKKQKAAVAAKNAQAQKQKMIDNRNKACYGKIYSNVSGGFQMRFLPCDANGNGRMDYLEVLYGTTHTTYQLKPRGIVIHNNGNPMIMFFTNSGCLNSKMGIIRPSNNMARYKNF